MLLGEPQQERRTIIPAPVNSALTLFPPVNMTLTAPGALSQTCANGLTDYSGIT